MDNENNNTPTDKVITMEEFESGQHLTTQMVLDAAKEADLDQAIICGTKDGKFFVSSSCKDVQTAVFLSNLFTNTMYNGLGTDYE